MSRLILSIGILCVAGMASGDEKPGMHAQYLANAGVMVRHGATKILFDPLFRNDFGQYDLMPDDLELALFDGAPPLDDVDAVFISHYHEDHFDPRLILRYLRSQPDVELYAPTQAVDALAGLITAKENPYSGRIHGISLEIGMPSVATELGGLRVDALRVPHSGWPDYHATVENIVFRVTLDDAATVMHLGDADPHIQHYEPNASYWSRRHTDLALPPYWFFLSPNGRQVLETYIKAGHTIGVHAPNSIPDKPENRPDDFRDRDLFTRPGETRSILPQ